MASDCLPPDGFWKANRDLAERLWRRGDGATVSTRVAEDVNAATGIPIATAKTAFHGVTSIAVGVGAAKLTRAPVIGVLAALGSFAYLQRDRC